VKGPFVEGKKGGGMSETPHQELSGVPETSLAATAVVGVWLL